MRIPVWVDGNLEYQESVESLQLLVPNRDNCNCVQARRAVLHMGWTCSYNCVFCYGQNSRKEEFRTYDSMVEELHSLYDYGIRDIEFSGGEPTQYKQLPQLIEQAVRIGYRRIGIITNGSKLCNLKYFKMLQSVGLNEVLFSVHGYDEKSHDKITGKVGSWKALTKSISNAVKLNCFLRVNTTICKFNAGHLKDHAQMILSLADGHLKCVNYLPLNYWDDAIDSDRLDVNPQEYCTDLEEAIAILESAGIQWIAIRYAPFCAFPKLTRYIVGQYQHMYDPFDWNREAYTTQSFDLSYPYGYFAYEACANTRKALYTKASACALCKYVFLCDGLENQLVEHGVRPVKGEPILDVMAEHQGGDNSKAYADLFDEPVLVKVAEQFSIYPGGRIPSDGPNSGEELRERLLVPALQTGKKVIVDLDGTLGYAHSFLEEAFGGLVRHQHFTYDYLSHRLSIKSEHNDNIVFIWSAMYHAQ